MSQPKFNTNEALDCNANPEPRPHFYFEGINTPGFTFKHLSDIVKISYRKIKDWDSKNIISGTRKNKNLGWRKFSLMDFLKFQIIADLKEFGLKADAIIAVFSEIDNYPIMKYQAESTTDVFQSKKVLPAGMYQINEPTLEYFFTACSNGEKYLLFIDNKSKITFKLESSLSHDISNFSNPHLFLPFFTYVKKIHDFLNEKIDILEWTTIKSFRETLKISYAENQILKFINNRDFNEIKITRNGANEIIIRAKTNVHGKLSVQDVLDAISKQDYQNIQLSRVNGEIVNISREVTFKV